MCLIRGQCFTHKHWTNAETGEPLRCVVTTMRQGVIYYRPKYTNPDGSERLGAPAYFPAARWQEYVKMDSK